MRTVWNEQEEKWYFCVTDVVEALTDSTNPTDYIKKMRKRDPMLAEGWGQIVTPLPFQTQGGKQITDIITREWSGLSTKEYKQFKGLRKGNLRDNMTNLEIALNTLAEASAAELSKQRDPQGFNAQKQIAKDGSVWPKSPVTSWKANWEGASSRLRKRRTSYLQHRT